MTKTNASQHLVLKAFGGPENFEILEQPVPQPGAGEIRVRVLAASVQFTDIILRTGNYVDLKDKAPLTLGYDCVGVVEALGEGVTAVRVGDRVADLTMIGSYAEHRLLRADQVVQVPDDVDSAEATSLVLSWLTAYQLMHRHAKVASGQRVLIHGAAGAVGRALLRLGQLHGLKMVGTCRAEHADLVASFGAIPIDYRNEDFTEVLADGVDVVFDGIGEAGFAKSWSILNKGGFLSAFGFSHGLTQGASTAKMAYWYMRLPVWNVLPNGKKTSFYSITDYRKKHADHFDEDLGQLFEWLRDGTIEPRIAHRIGLDEVADAHRQLEAGGLNGKIVMTPNGALA